MPPDAAAVRSGQEIAEDPADDELDQPRLQLRLAADTRARMANVDHRPGRRDDVDRPYGAGVQRHVAADHEKHPVVRAGRRDDIRCVDRAERLLVAPAVVDDQVVAVDGHVDADPVRALRLSVVLLAVLGRIRPLGQARDRLPHPGLGVVEQGRDRLVDAAGSVLVVERLEPARPDAERPDQRVQVAPGRLGRPVVGEDDAPDVPDRLAAPDDLDRRQAQPFLVDLGGVRREGAGRHAADLGHVPDGAHEALQLAVVEERRDQEVLRHV